MAPEKPVVGSKLVQLRSSEVSEEEADVMLNQTFSERGCKMTGAAGQALQPGNEDK